MYSCTLVASHKLLFYVYFPLPPVCSMCSRAKTMVWSCVQLETTRRGSAPQELDQNYLAMSSRWTTPWKSIPSALSRLSASVQSRVQSGQVQVYTPSSGPIQNRELYSGPIQNRVQYCGTIQNDVQYSGPIQNRVQFIGTIYSRVQFIGLSNIQEQDIVQYHISYFR